MTLLGLIRYHVLFVIDIASRTVEVAGIGRDPSGRWMEQMARNLVDAEDGFLLGKRYLLIDRVPLYTEAFRGILKGAGVKMHALSLGRIRGTDGPNYFVTDRQLSCRSSPPVYTTNCTSATWWTEASLGSPATHEMTSWRPGWMSENPP